MAIVTFKFKNGYISFNVDNEKALKRIAGDLLTREAYSVKRNQYIYQRFKQI